MTSEEEDDDDSVLLPEEEDMAAVPSFTVHDSVDKEENKEDC